MKDDLAYINNYPLHQKYLSLFPPENESEESKKVREETYKKVMKSVQVKREIRDKELWEADVKMADDFATQKNTDAVEADAFFALESEPSDEEHVEKRAVMRDGRVPML